MELQGKIIQVLPMQEGTGRSGNAWKLQPYVLETQEQYPKKVYFEVFGEDRIKQNPAQEGDVVKIDIDIESREYNGRWFTQVRAWKIEGGTNPESQEDASVDNTFNAENQDSLFF